MTRSLRHKRETRVKIELLDDGESELEQPEPKRVKKAQSVNPEIFKGRKADLPAVDPYLGKERQARELKMNLARLCMDQERLVDELFYLTNFTSLISYNENNINKESENYKSFAEENGLWEFSNSRRQSRRGVVEHPLKTEIDGMTVTEIPVKEEPQVSQIKSEEKEVEEVPEEETSYDDNHTYDSELEMDLVKMEKFPQKFKINFHLPKQQQLDVGHVTHPNFASLQHFLQSYWALDEDYNKEEYAEHFEQQKLLIERIKNGLLNGTLRIDYKENLDKGFTGKEPTMVKLNARLSRFKDPVRYHNLPTHQDHLITQGVISARKLYELRKERLQKTRKIAQMVESYFKRKYSSKERIAKDQQAKVQRLARDTARMVKKKWQQAEKAFNILEERKRERERAIKSKEHLSEILEHSTQLLEKQRRASESSASDSNMSSDESDSDDEDDNDNDLSIAELRKKYGTESSRRESSREVEKPEMAPLKEIETPSLLRGTLRIYQQQGLNWLASLYNNGTNGILADEMGLGKTIQTIALLSYLACEKHVWGPHLIVVPTSVMLNWEMEFKRFAPGFKVLTYYGNPQQRKEKRKGWNKPDTFHVCITSYQLVLHDHSTFRRKKWKYMILDEAHNIKNFRSQRWQALLNFNTENRLLLTGTPLQNNIMELWSLLYFLMPSTRPEGFANLMDFQNWFGKPVDKAIEAGGDAETRKTVAKLHQVLRPYLLRRLKSEVEKQMPLKYEHIVSCRLSKRQRFLYDEFMSRAQTKETLVKGNYLSIINCLMQLRKVCNHPDLFEVRPVKTSFAMEKSIPADFVVTDSTVKRLLEHDSLDYQQLNLLPAHNFTSTHAQNAIRRLQGTSKIQSQCEKLEEVVTNHSSDTEPLPFLEQFYRSMKQREQVESLGAVRNILRLNKLRCDDKPIYPENLLRTVSVKRTGPTPISIQERAKRMSPVIEKYAFVTPSVVALNMAQLCLGDVPRQDQDTVNSYHQAQTKLSIAFPEKSLLQYDCGKLQKLATLLQELSDGGHRALIFTQMTRVLDVLEQFLNIHGYRYMRLDGATKIEDRQLLTERFNSDPRIMCFILSTRSGGLGINLTGADTVIFYDSDWNPAMDKQCQDRCHRIGQTRDVHIYRFVSEHTIEQNILRKANQKRQLDNVVIQEGDFTTDFSGMSVREILGAEAQVDRVIEEENIGGAMAQAEDADDVAAANVAIQEMKADDQDFQEAEERSGGESDEDEVGHVDEYMIRFITNGYYEM